MPAGLQVHLDDKVADVARDPQQQEALRSDNRTATQELQGKKQQQRTHKQRPRSAPGRRAQAAEPVKPRARGTKHVPETQVALLEGDICPEAIEVDQGVGIGQRDGAQEGPNGPSQIRPSGATRQTAPQVVPGRSRSPGQEQGCRDKGQQERPGVLRARRQAREQACEQSRPATRGFTQTENPQQTPQEPEQLGQVRMDFHRPAQERGRCRQQDGAGQRSRKAKDACAHEPGEPEAPRSGDQADRAHGQENHPVGGLQAQRTQHLEEPERNVIEQPAVAECLQFQGPAPVQVTHHHRGARLVDREDVGHPDVVGGLGYKGCQAPGIDSHKQSRDQHVSAEYLRDHCQELTRGVRDAGPGNGRSRRAEVKRTHNG